MRRPTTRTLISIAATAALAGCASAYRLAPDDANAFAGFVALEDGEARVLFYRPRLFVGDLAILYIDLEGCRFQLGVDEFAVCRVAPGVNFITGGTAAIPVEAPGGAWSCITTGFGTDQGVKRVECAEIAERLSTADQVWTTQSPLEAREKRRLESPGRKQTPGAR